MSYHGREIEIKLQVHATLSAVYQILHYEFGISRMVFDTSTDTYWSLRSDVLGDFIRMRELSDGIVQVTVKAKDRGDNINRVERELETGTSAFAVRNLLTAAHGKATARITKTYYVLWLEGENEHTNISCYSVEGHESDGVYIEIESTNVDKVLDLESKVLDLFDRIERAEGSLYELYVQPRQE